MDGPSSEVEKFEEKKAQFKSITEYIKEVGMFSYLFISRFPWTTLMMSVLQCWKHANFSVCILETPNKHGAINKWYSATAVWKVSINYDKLKEAQLISWTFLRL